MIKKITMYTAICDICQEFLLIQEQFSALNDKRAVIDEVDNHNWSTDRKDKIYCPNCHSLKYNEVTDEYIIISKEGNPIGPVK